MFLPGSEGLLKPIEKFCADKDVSEILVNRPGEVWVEKGQSLKQYKVAAFHEMHLYRLFQLIASENHQRLSRQYPLLSGSLKDGSRVQLCLPPVSVSPVMSIRKKVLKQVNLNECASMNMFHAVQASASTKSAVAQELNALIQANQWHALIKRAVALKQNIIISGGTSSGKTTFLNACLREVDFAERLLILEDTREVSAPHLNQVQLLAIKGDQGQAKVSMQDLVQCSLRLRPDRIIMGEIRGAEMMDFIAACSTGHEGSITTIHANSPDLALMRMLALYKLNNVPAMTDADILAAIKSVVDLIVQLVKTPSGRRVSEVCFLGGEKTFQK